MFVFISLNNGRLSWVTAPLMLLLPALLNSGVLPALLKWLCKAFFASYFVLACAVLILAALPRQRNQVRLQVSTIATTVGTLMSRWQAWCSAAQGGAATVNQQQGDSNTQQGERFNRVVSTLRTLPLLAYCSKDDIQNMTACQLKGRFKQLKLEYSGLLEKEELVAKLLAHGGSSSCSCSICCDSYSKGDALRVLACSHMFHVECIDRWFFSVTGNTLQMACPLCNAPLVGP